MPYLIAGIDVHKKMLAVVVADVEVDGDFYFERQKVGTTPADLRGLAEWLAEHEVEEVVITRSLPLRAADLKCDCSASAASTALSALQVFAISARSRRLRRPSWMPTRSLNRVGGFQELIARHHRAARHDRERFSTLADPCGVIGSVRH